MANDVARPGPGRGTIAGALIGVAFGWILKGPPTGAIAAQAELEDEGRQPAK